MKARVLETPAMSNACRGCLHSRLINTTDSRMLACHHPATAQAHRNPMADVVRRLGNALPYPVPGLAVEAYPDGVELGLFAWPWRFDPIWLVSCDGYEPESEAA